MRGAQRYTMINKRHQNQTTTMEEEEKVRNARWIRLDRMRLSGDK